MSRPSAMKSLKRRLAAAAQRRRDAKLARRALLPNVVAGVEQQREASRRKVER